METKVWDKKYTHHTKYKILCFDKGEDIYEIQQGICIEEHKKKRYGCVVVLARVGYIMLLLLLMPADLIFWHNGTRIHG